MFKCHCIQNQHEKTTHIRININDSDTYWTQVSVGDVIVYQNQNKTIYSLVLGFEILTKNNPEFKSNDPEVFNMNKKQELSLYTKFQLTNLQKIDNVLTPEYYITLPYELNEKDIKCINVQRLSSFQELQQKWQINKTFYINNQHPQFNPTSIAKIFEHLRKVYAELNPFNENRIPINVITFVDKFKSGNLSSISFGTLRMRFVDLPSVFQNLMENLPIITIYPQSLDAMGIIKMFDQIFTDNVNNVININGDKYILHIFSIAADTIERYNVCGNLRANSSDLICPVCNIQKYSIIKMRKYVQETFIDDNEYDSDSKDINIDDTIFNDIFCSYNCSKYEYKTLYQNLSIKMDIMSCYQYDTHHFHNIASKWTNSITRIIGIEYYHSFGNSSAHLINDLMSLMSTDELLTFKKAVSLITKIKINMITARKLANLAHHLKLNLLWKLSFALIPTLKLHRLSLIDQFLCKIEYIVLYSLIYAFIPYPDKHFNMYDITIKVLKYMLQISEFCKNITGDTNITNITLHQITGLCLSSLLMFKNIQHLTTNMFECGMRQLKAYLKKFKFNINQTMLSVVNKRNIIFLLRGFLFDSVNNNFIFNVSNGKRIVSNELYTLKETLKFTRVHNSLIRQQILYIPIKNNNVITKVNVHVPFLANDIDDENISFDSKIFSTVPNEWKTQNYYLLNLKTFGLVYAKLKKIIQNKDNTYDGTFVLFKYAKKIYRNGYRMYIKDVHKKVQLLKYPYQVMMFKITVQDIDYYLLHPLYVWKRKFQVKLKYIKQILNYLDQNI